MYKKELSFSFSKDIKKIVQITHSRGAQHFNGVNGDFKSFFVR